MDCPNPASFFFFSNRSFRLIDLNFDIKTKRAGWKIGHRFEDRSLHTTLRYLDYSPGLNCFFVLGDAARVVRR